MLLFPPQIEEQDFHEWLQKTCDQYGANLELISERTAHGKKFIASYGGVGAILRYAATFTHPDDLYESHAMLGHVSSDTESEEDSFAFAPSRVRPTSNQQASLRKKPRSALGIVADAIRQQARTAGLDVKPHPKENPNDQTKCWARDVVVDTEDDFTDDESRLRKIAERKGKPGEGPKKVGVGEKVRRSVAMVAGAVLSFDEEEVSRQTARPTEGSSSEDRASTVSGRSSSTNGSGTGASEERRSKKGKNKVGNVCEMICVFFI